MKVKTGDKITITTTTENLTVGLNYVVEDMFDGLIVITDNNGDPVYIDEEDFED